jgi:hypothetical protein
MKKFSLPRKVFCGYITKKAIMRAFSCSPLMALVPNPKASDGARNDDRYDYEYYVKEYEEGPGCEAGEHQRLKIECSLEVF